MLNDVVKGLSKEISVDDYFNYLYSGLFNSETCQKFKCIKSKINNYYIIKNNCVDVIEDDDLNKLDITREDFDLIKSTNFYFICIFNKTMGSTLGFSCGEHTYSGFSVAEAVVNNMVHPSHKITYIHQGLVVMSALGMIITLAAMTNFGTFKKWSSDGTFSYSRKYTIEAKKFNNTSRTNKIDGITYSFYGDVLDDKLKFRKYDLLTNITSGYSKDIKCIQVETSSPYGLSFESFKIDLFINYSFNKSYIDTISSRSIYDFRPSKNASFRYFGLTYYGSSYVAYAYVYKIYVYIG